MSEDFLKRWSQRKRDAAEAEQAGRTAPENAAPAGDERPSEAVEAIKPAEPPKPALDLKDLPPIESITAATDIRPFLQPGVPADIARAALRRAWSADPRIRDFVGLADYDWDYHAGASAAGFGPLEMTDELRRAVARILGEVTEASRPAPAGERIVGIESPEESRIPGAEADVSPTVVPACSDRRSPDRSDQAASMTSLDAPDTAVAVLQHENREGEGRRPTPRRGHGRALPK